MRHSCGGGVVRDVRGWVVRLRFDFATFGRPPNCNVSLMLCHVEMLQHLGLTRHVDIAMRASPGGHPNLYDAMSVKRQTSLFESIVHFNFPAVLLTEQMALNLRR